MPLTDALLLDAAPFNVWIAARTDGIKGCGTTPGDPFDGSTQSRFDAVMQTIAAQFPGKKVAIHLGPGTFETRGYPNSGGWQIKAGMRILGSGIDVTTIIRLSFVPPKPLSSSFTRTSPEEEKAFLSTVAATRPCKLWSLFVSRSCRRTPIIPRRLKSCRKSQRWRIE